MKFIKVAFCCFYSCAANVAYAQSPTGNATEDASLLPPCVKSCFTLGVDAVGCAITDFACHCSPAHNATIYEIGLPCLATNCTASQSEIGLDLIADICSLTLASETVSSSIAAMAPTPTPSESATPSSIANITMTTTPTPSAAVIPTSFASKLAVHIGSFAVVVLGLVAAGSI